MKKILLVFGTRPEAIKMAPLVNTFKAYPEDFQTVVCVTGQHRQMLDQVLQLFQIVPDYDLDIMKAGQDLYDITSRVLLGMRDILSQVQPNVVFVHGDTTTSTATALAAFYQQIPVAHVEAGLRTHNIYSPWPEEVNRQITGRITTYHLSPTVGSKANLLKENVAESSILVTGNTVIDALQWVNQKIQSDKAVSAQLAADLYKMGYDIDRLNGDRKLVLITGHRRENFGEGFLNICRAIKTLAAKYPDVDFVYPMHLNPNVRKPIQTIFGELSSPDGGGREGVNIFFIEPLDYLPFVFLMGKSYLLLTDSGGIQEEAPGLGKPVLVMRDTTERPEAVEAGTVKLVGTDMHKIIKAVSELLEQPELYKSMSMAVNPYGDGKASERIVEMFRD
ncbi:MAG: UDP-N-acetylglucosamine 2-epimerase (non-hydrolyzing) [Paludibacter sp.]|jgi:UDP-N-acetylglucosamine 2-epimerase (non-hydrolysing)|nr:UDP-N-acetylglucosamine 2-epimerase (non-hydrolyzing) [Paludibacter sp.]